MTFRELEKLKVLIWMDFGPLGPAKSIFSVEVRQEREMPGLAGGGASRERTILRANNREKYREKCAPGAAHITRMGECHCGAWIYKTDRDFA